MSGADRICTIVARNYVAQARVLAASAAEHAPGSPFTTLVIDGDEADRSLKGIGEVLLPEDLGFDPAVVGEMQLIYDVMEYATALKPALLMKLLRRMTRTATYLDPDIRLFNPIDAAFEASAASGLALTPHTIEPIPRDGRLLNEAVVMHAGIYNLGFVSASGSAYRFLTWWRDRLRTDAIVDLTNALFTDQRWMDWAPALARPTILRDKGFNAAYWNLHERPVEGSSTTGWTVGGAPLRFFHFSGYDPARPDVLSKHQGAHPRNLLSEQPALRSLCTAYGAELVAAGHIELRRKRYRHETLPSGLRLTSPIRRLCRDAILRTEESLGSPPNPWGDEPGFLRWLLDDDLGSARAQFSRFEYAIWRSRPDLRAAFPDPIVANAADFRDWLDTSPEVDDLRRYAGLTPRTKAAAAAPRVARKHPTGGWSVVGYAQAELGVGEAGRRIARAIAFSGIPWEMVGITDGPLSRQNHAYRGSLSTTPSYANQILCINADQTPRIAAALGNRAAAGRRIGYWFWELEKFPERYRDAFRHVDEVWVSGEFNRATIAEHTDKPVSVVSPPVALRHPAGRFTREQLGLPRDKFVFLLSFDYLSVLARKNPLGAIEAYTNAFGPDDGCALVVKSINGHLRLLDRERVRIAVQGRPDIILREEYVSAAQIHALADAVDCVVSLHRAEGFGLNLLDAMANGTPVIATGYSGNMEFMDDRSAFLVPYELREVGPGSEPYDATAVWAEPDLHVASLHMRAVRDNAELTATVVAAARERLEPLDPRNVGRRLRPLLVPDLAPATITEHRA